MKSSLTKLIIIAFVFLYDEFPSEYFQYILVNISKDYIHTTLPIRHYDLVSNITYIVRANIIHKCRKSP